MRREKVRMLGIVYMFSCAGSEARIRLGRGGLKTKNQHLSSRLLSPINEKTQDAGDVNLPMGERACTQALQI